MDPIITQILLIMLTTLSPLLLFIYRFAKPNYGKNRAPTAGGALPIIGHLHLFGKNQLLHKTLSSLADKHGPTFTVRLGYSQETLVVSTWEIAKECFTTHDKAFADRPKVTASRLLTYDFAMFGFAPYGPYSCKMRKIVTFELLSHRRVKTVMSRTCASEVKASLGELLDLSGIKPGELVDMKQWFGDMTLNAACRMVVGTRFVGETGRQKAMVKDFFSSMGVFVLSDALPFLGWLDLQGHEKRMKVVAKELDGVIEEWLVEHKERRKNSKVNHENEDFMDVMLNILEDTEIPDFDADTINKATCLNLILAGNDTIMVALTWALSLLLNNPLSLKKAQEEVDRHVPKTRLVAESDIQNLVYLQAVVKETLRLYPPAPVIAFRSSMEDCTLSPGYHVPAGTRLMVNAWKIHRDESIWPEPHEFRPDRFLTSHSDIDVWGKNFELIPFGSGRRSCPGTGLALQMVHLTLASLLHCFEFNRPGGAEIDMTESQGITNLKATPLEVYLAPRVSPETFGV